MVEYETLGDVTLILAVARFDQDALNEIYRRYGGSVIALATRLIGSRAMAEDVAQEVFLRLWHEPLRFRPERGSLRAFLLANTHSRAIDLLRSEGARRRREDREARARMVRSSDVDREIVTITTSAYVREALEDLSQHERGAIELAYFEGLTYREVADVLQQPEGTVKSRIRSGLAKLSTILVEVES
ncbi:MAG: RNA polymerase sigma factor [Acidimicrobiales bacterium]